MAYIAWCEERGGDEKGGRKVDAYDAESAAKAWAEWHDRNTAEYAIASGDETVVTVKDTESGDIERYTVVGESVPAYYAVAVPNATSERGE